MRVTEAKPDFASALSRAFSTAAFSAHAIAAPFVAIRFIAVPGAVFERV